jgi:hypothetical protein
MKRVRTEFFRSGVPLGRDLGSARAPACWLRRLAATNFFLGMEISLVPNQFLKSSRRRGAFASTRGRVRSPDYSERSVPRIAPENCS